MKDVGQVHDGWLVQQNVVREDGRRSVLLSIIKNGNASTLDVVNGVHEALKTARAAAPPGLEINELFDQSVFVKHSVDGVLREGAIAAGLTALMILLFLGSWRSTLVVMISIPLSILTSLVVLYFLGETLNTMTLGGLALAVGILVDDSTVTIENTHRSAHRRRDAAAGGDAARVRRHCRADLGLDARHQLRLHLGRLPRRASEVPVHAARIRRRVRHAGLLRPVANADARSPSACCSRASIMARRTASSTELCLPAFTAAFERGFEQLRRGYVALLDLAAQSAHHRPDHRRAGTRAWGRDAMLSSVAISFRPSTADKSSSTSAHQPVPASKCTEHIFQAVEDKIREIIPESDRELIVDNIGLPARAYNLAFADGSTIGVNDGVILVSLKDGHAPTADYVRKLRAGAAGRIPRRHVLFPGGRHGHSDPEFRLAGTNRRPHRRL